MEKIVGVYKIQNIESGKVYVGCSIDVKNRFKGHKRELNKNKHGNKHLQYAWDKYGSKSFCFEIIEETSSEILLEREKFWIASFDATNGRKGYNVCSFGISNLGIKRSEETKEKLRQANIGKTYLEEVNAKKGKKGIPKEKAQSRTAEEKAIVSANISASKKGKKLDIDPVKKAEAQQKIWETRRKNGTAKGYTHIKQRPEGYGKKLWENRRANGTDKISEEGKKKISEFWIKRHKEIGHNRGMLGKVMSPETREKMRLSQQARRQKEDT